MAFTEQAGPSGASGRDPRTVGVRRPCSAASSSARGTGDCPWPGRSWSSPACSPWSSSPPPSSARVPLLAVTTFARRRRRRAGPHRQLLADRATGPRAPAHRGAHLDELRAGPGLLRRHDARRHRHRRARHDLGVRAARSSAPRSPASPPRSGSAPCCGRPCDRPQPRPHRHVEHRPAARARARGDRRRPDEARLTRGEPTDHREHDTNGDGVVLSDDEGAKFLVANDPRLAAAPITAAWRWPCRRSALGRSRRACAAATRLRSSRPRPAGRWTRSCATPSPSSPSAPTSPSRRSPSRSAAPAAVPPCSRPRTPRSTPRAARVDRDAIAWDAWRREDGKWIVSATYSDATAPTPRSGPTTTRGRNIHPLDDEARLLMGARRCRPRRRGRHRRGARPGRRHPGGPRGRVGVASAPGRRAGCRRRGRRA